MEKTKPPPKQQASFLIRVRTLRKGGVRYQVRHILSGEEVEGDSLEAVLVWLKQFRQEQDD